MRQSLFFIALILTLSLGHIPTAESGNDTLVVGMQHHFDSLCQTRSTSRQTLLLSHNWADTLVYRNPASGKLVPCLAESYRVGENGALEFTLRKGVRFHNGEPLTADAVRFSMNVFRARKACCRNLFRAFGDVSIVDERTVRIHSTLHPSVALEILANVFFIYPPGYYRKVGGEAFGKHPVGTGPYRFVSWEEEGCLRFEAHSDYFGAPKKKPGIPHLVIRIIPEQIIRIERLLNGELDLIRSGSIAPEQIQYLERHPDITVRRANILRNFFLLMDARGRSGTDFFKQRKVRRAVNLAINRQHLVTDVLCGYARVNHGVATPQHFGYEPDIRTYAYDPERAQTLLAEAGYPGGFKVDLYVHRDESVAEAVAQNLRTVGIRAEIRWMEGRVDQLIEKFRNGETPFAFFTWGSYSIFDASAILNPWFLQDEPLCHGTTPEIDLLLRKSDRCVSEEERKRLLSLAQQIIAEEAFWAPLYYGNSVAAMRAALDFQPSQDEVDRYFLATWNESR